MPVTVTYFQRKRRPGANYSLEFIFDDVRERLAGKIDALVHVAPYLSNGFLPRLAIAVDARRNQHGINHVTGDINFVAIGLDRRRTISTILDCGFVARSTGWKRYLLKLIWLDWPVRRSAIVTTISEVAKSEIVALSGCDPRKVRVVPVAISTRFKPHHKNFCGDSPRILQVGTAPNKNIERLMEAITKIPCTLVVVGKLSDQLRDKARSLGICLENRCNLSLDEIVKEYEACDLVAFPSTYEGFGMPILEGNAVGRPVLTSCVSSMPEVAGEAACLVDPFDVNSIRAGIEKIVSDREYRDSLVRAGFTNVQRFHPQRIAEQYLSLYEEMATMMTA